MKEIITTLVSMMLLVGCNSQTDALESKLQRELNPNATDTELQQLITDNNEFAYTLYKHLDDKENNTFFSPISISHALMMTYAGTGGETRKEMKTALNMTLDDSRVHQVYNKLELALNINEDQNIFKIVNSIWPSKDFAFEQNYLDTLLVNYGATLRTLDYLNQPDESRKTINSWVEDKTEGKITALIPEGAISTMTKMILSNATYFKAAWEHPFDSNSSKKGIFNNTIETDFMSQTEVFPYFEDENLQAIKLNYKTGKNSMVLILPKGDSYDIKGDFTKHRVTLKMPKFEFTSKSMSLTEILKKLGMKSAFDSNKADFSMMSQSSSLYISDILHKAFIKVDEQGSEAAAATTALLNTTGYEEVPTAELTLDKPFVYMIIDNETKLILFMGRMIKP